MKPGFIATYTVLMVMVVVVAVTLAVMSLSIGSAQSSVASGQGKNTLAFVEGCVEDAMIKAWISPTFGDPVNTPVTITRPEGSCQVTVISKIANVWTMTVTNATNTSYKHTVQVVITRGATALSLTSWLEQ